MEKKIRSFYEILKKDRKLSPWSKDNTFKDRAEQLDSESKEILEAIEKEDLNNLKEELGDALWDLMFLSIIAEEKGLFTFEDVIDSADEKLKRRKPWIFTGENVSMDEEIRRWAEAKRKEKGSGLVKNDS